MSIVSSACSLAGPICSVVKDAAGTAAGAVGGGILDSIASEFSSAEGEMLKLLLSAWVNVPTPNLSSTSGTVGFLQSSLSWYVAAAAVLGLLVAAGRLAIERKPDAAKDAATGMLTTLLTIGAGVATISLLSAAGDAFSTWILDQAAGSATPTQALTQLGSFAGLMATGGAGLIILLSVLAIIGMVVQLAMVLIRSVLLVVLVGVWPLAAASSMTEMGRQWYKKITGWMIAFLLFKPAAAIVYAAAIKMTLSSDSVLASIEGIILIILASLTLPALMKFIVPAVSSVGSMGAGEVLGAGIAAATGAAMVDRHRRYRCRRGRRWRAGRVCRRRSGRWCCRRRHGWRNLRRGWAARRVARVVVVQRPTGPDPRQRHHLQRPLRRDRDPRGMSAWASWSGPCEVEVASVRSSREILRAGRHRHDDCRSRAPSRAPMATGAARPRPGSGAWASSPR